MPFYRGNPAGARFVVTVLNDRSLIRGLDPRLDIRNHSPSGFAWGYSGSGPPSSRSRSCATRSATTSARRVYISTSRMP